MLTDRPETLQDMENAVAQMKAAAPVILGTHIYEVEYAVWLLKARAS